jgi:hypothetical protein
VVGGALTPSLAGIRAVSLESSDDGWSCSIQYLSYTRSDGGQGFPLVHFSAQRKHCLSVTLGAFSIYMGHNSSHLDTMTAQ